MVKFIPRGKNVSTEEHQKLSVESKYGEGLYMLNRCLDDIEYLVKKLKKYIRKQREASKGNGDPVRPSVPPSEEDATETIKKAKFAFNLAESLKECAPEAFKKVFIRLITFVDWMDDLCKTKSLIAFYPVNMVRDAIEPLLQKNTLNSIKELLDSTLKEKWLQLGNAWNTPP
ncbi:unnamed protein product [Echinostoma caproni]|uniref:GCFC domain-containing protein n=1 Tax=Echinostoma caproni TaxID=27848 RepID=A0A183AL35_9TREM|nr:unnamed protein product [Echinostoma caproni]